MTKVRPAKESSPFIWSPPKRASAALLTHPPANERHTSPAFSPDGKRIVLVRDFEGVMDLAILTLTSDLRPASAPSALKIADFKREVCANPRWTRDGSGIVFTFNRGGPQRLWHIRVPASLADSAAPTLIPVGEGAELPAFSPAGDRLAFTRHVRDDDLWRIGLPSGSRPASSPLRLMSSTRIERFADISSDGRVAFESDRSGFTEIWISDIDGVNARAVTWFQGPGTGSPRWSPDGQWIAFDTRADGQPEVYVLRVQGEQTNRSVPLRLTFHPGQDNLPAWSPDGRTIYFNSNRSGLTQVWRAPASGGEPTLVSPGEGRGPIVSPDGAWVYYSRGSHESSEVWRVPAQGGPESRIVNDVIDRSFVPRRDGLWFLRRQERQAASLNYLIIRSGKIGVAAELSGRIQPGLAVWPDETLALFSRTDEGTRDLMLVEGFVWH